MNMTPTDEGTPPAAETPASEGMRKLDEAAGGGEVPIGPLGGPTPKTRERLLAEQELASGAEAEREAIDAAKEEVKAEQAAAETPPAEGSGPLT